MASIGVENIGNGLGYIYVKDLDGNVIYSLLNNREGVNQALSLGQFATPITGSIIPIGIVSIDSASNAGSDTITDIRINGINIINSPVSIVDSDEAATAVALSVEINASTPPSGIRYTAQANGSQVILTPTGITNYEIPNGHTVVAIFGGTSVITTSDITGGVNASSRRNAILDISQVIDPVRGLTFFLDADYGVGGLCSGDGQAEEGDASNAIDVTKYFITKTLTSGIDSVGNVVIDNGSITVERFSAITAIYYKASSGSTDNLISINPTGWVNGDIIFLFNEVATEDITVEPALTSGGNLQLAASTEFTSAGNESLMIMFDAKIGEEPFFREISRSIPITPLIETADIADAAVTTAKLATNAVTSNILASTSVTSVKIATEAVTTSKIQNRSVTTAKLADGAVTIDKLEDAVKIDLINVYVSFEAGSQGDYKVKFPYECILESLEAFVVTPIEATEDATILPKNQGLTVMNDAVMVFPAGLSNGTAVEVTPTANNTFQANEILTLTAGKTTPGGSVMISLAVVKTGADGAIGGTILFQAPSFASFLLSGISVLEVGDSIAAGGQTFTWTTTNSGNVLASSIEIADVTNATILGTALTNDGVEVLTFPSAITKTAIGVNKFSITGTNTQTGLFVRNYDVNWRFRAFYGNDSNPGTLSEAQVEALSNNPLKSSFAGEYTFLGGDYKYLCFPSAWGTANAFLDKLTSFVVPFQAPYTVSVTNAFGVVENYNVYRSTNILNSDITIVVS